MQERIPEYRAAEPTIFEVWMRILAAVPRSVLWLLDGTPQGRENLRLKPSSAVSPCGGAHLKYRGCGQSAV